MILFKVNRLNKVSTLLPTKNEILKLYNKYRKGYDYTKEAWEMKDKVLYAAKELIERSKKYQAIEDSEEYPGDYWRKHKDQLIYVTELWKNVELSAMNLERTKDPFDILVAIDHIFNLLHEQGFILTGLVDGWNYSTDEGEVGKFLETLNQIRDW